MASEGKHSMGQRVSVKFTVLSYAIEVGAVVRWSDDSGVGLQFDGMRARDVWALNEFFKKQPRR